MKCIRETDRKCKNWPTVEELQLTKLSENNARILLFKWFGNSNNIVIIIGHWQFYLHMKVPFLSKRMEENSYSMHLFFEMQFDYYYTRRFFYIGNTLIFIFHIRWRNRFEFFF